MKLQLLCFAAPSSTGVPVQTRAALGLTHVSFVVEDLASVESRMVVLGGTVVEQTREHTKIPGGVMDIVYLADPDGVRIELVQYGPGDTTASAVPTEEHIS
jgi:lactoylglutathione lyase